MNKSKVGVVKTIDKTHFVVLSGSDKNIKLHKKTMEMFFILNGDTVKVKIIHKRSGKVAKITQVIHRNKDTFLCKLKEYNTYILGHCLEKHIPFNIYLPLNPKNSVLCNEMCLIKVYKWGIKHKFPDGQILEVLSNAKKNDVQLKLTTSMFDIKETFPQAVIEDVCNISQSITQDIIDSRKDLRNITTFTIDPDNAKDFDDAISVKKIKSDVYEIGVHIADVSHYVKQQSSIDIEAKERSFSVYMIDKVIPMLPEKLSNDLCSLRPLEDKLCISVIFTIDNKTNILNVWFGDTIIHSNRRFTYQEAQHIIDTQKGEYHEEIHILNTLAKILRSKRQQSGAILFNNPELDILLDNNKYPINIHKKDILESNKLIEEWMLLANKHVAKFLKEKKKYILYRVHEKPDMDKVQEMVRTLHSIGVKISNVTPENLKSKINIILEDSNNQHNISTINTIIIKSLKKAIYSPNNLGHYGLGFDVYTHFTSPIRRYTDILIHRTLKYVLGGNKNKYNIDNKLPEHLLEKECNSISAERFYKKLKQAEYMEKYINKKTEGVISSITNWGIYVELTKYMCEGMITIKSLKSRYIFNKENQSLTNLHTGETFYQGKQITVKIVQTNDIKGFIDVVICN